ncbi:MAG: hypothetical protein MJ081_00125 [Ruminococcus sp.]|nr:hypothetical protein [Ruminococcus sp.]
MKSNDINTNKDVEKLLTDKMNELSDNVDCLDKIIARAFPDEDSVFTDSEFTVTGLENITGRRNYAPFIKFGVFAACAVFCIGILPKTTAFREALSNFSSSTNGRAFNSVLRDFKNATEDISDYRIYDISLDEYVKNDVIITPLYSCPFEYSSAEDIRVRLYIRTIGDTLTNQMYAVEYCDTYSESNILAIADTGSKFTLRDIEKYSAETNDNKTVYENESCDIMASAVLSNDRYGNLTDKESNAVTAASFVQECFFKADDEILKLASYIFYYNKNDVPDKYYYDMVTFDENGNDLELYAPKYSMKLWNRAVYCDGTSAMQKTNVLGFEKTDIQTDNVTPNSVYMMPYTSNSKTDSTNLSPINNLEIHRYEQKDMGIIGTINTPYDVSNRSQLKIYHSSELSFLLFSSYITPKIVIKSDYPVDKSEFKLKDLQTFSENIYESDRALAEELEEKQRLQEEMKRIIAEEDARITRETEEKYRKQAEEESKKAETSISEEQQQNKK